MASESDEQTWWSSMLGAGRDPGLQMPDGVWDSAVASALDPDTPWPEGDLIPTDNIGDPIDADIGEFDSDEFHPHVHPSVDETTRADFFDGHDGADHHPGPLDEVYESGDHGDVDPGFLDGVEDHGGFD